MVDVVSILAWCGGIVVLMYGVLPVLIRIFPGIAQKVVFLNFVQHPYTIGKDLTKPEKFGLKNCRNLYLTVDKHSTVGIWHVLPKNMAVDVQNDDGFWDRKLQDGHPIILYLHGNSSSRGQPHRVELLKLLSHLNYHVIALDYRGFGDSKGVPSEDGVVADSYHVYRWIKDRCKDSPLIIWGHSLGTGIGTKLSKHLCEKGDHPHGLVLQSPFNNLKHLAKHHPFSILFRFLPWFDWAFIKALDKSELYFKNDENIASVTVPILLLHAEDDFTIPYDLCLLLHEEANRVHKDKEHVKLISFSRKHKYGHNGIYRAPELPHHVQNFMSCITKQ